MCAHLKFEVYVGVLTIFPLPITPLSSLMDTIICLLKIDWTPFWKLCTFKRNLTKKRKRKLGQRNFSLKRLGDEKIFRLAICLVTFFIVVKLWAYITLANGKDCWWKVFFFFFFRLWKWYYRGEGIISKRNVGLADKSRLHHPKLMGMWGLAPQNEQLGQCPLMVAH